MLTGIGTPTAWPFFKRGGLAPPARRALGGSVGASATTLTLLIAPIAVGELVLVATVNDNAFSATDVTVDLDGNVFTQDNMRRFNTCRVTINSWLATVPIIGGTITADWSLADDPDNMALLAVVVSNLAGICRETTSAGAHTVNPDSGVTAAYAAANSYHFGAIGTIGRIDLDTLGTWQNAMTAGQRFGTVGGLGVDLKEGYRIPSPPATAQAHIHAQTSRATVAMVGYYD